MDNSKENKYPFQDKQVILVFGKACSGKDTFCEKMNYHMHISTGSIVRELVGKEERVFNKDLDSQIIDKLHEINNNHSRYQSYVISGIRTWNIVCDIIFSFGRDNIGFIWLEVPDEELKRRYQNSKRGKDSGLTFEETQIKDAELGLDNVELNLKKEIEELLIINH